MTLQRIAGAVLAACLSASLLAGCSAPDLDNGVATQLQQRVAAAKGLAAGQDYQAALAELDQLSGAVATAAGQGRISEPRRTRIDAAISAIRDDLEAALEPAPAPPAADPPVTEEQQEQEEEAREEAEKQLEEARKQAEKQREEAQKDAEKRRGSG